MVSEIIEKVDSEERLVGKINGTIPEDYLMPPNSPLKTRKDVFIMASIVKKEAGHDNERAKIEAVFLNRLNKGMKLQADPTSAYALTEGKYKLKCLLKRKDLKIKSPYNIMRLIE